MVAVAGLITDTLYFHFTVSFFEFFWGGQWGNFWAARTSLLLKENHYSIGTLAMITYSHCRQQIQKYAV